MVTPTYKQRLVIHSDIRQTKDIINVKYPSGKTHMKDGGNLPKSTYGSCDGKRRHLVCW